MGRLLSGRVGVTSYSGLSTHRNQTNGFPSFLGLEEAEPSLGLPANNEFILYANTNGERFWNAPPSGSGGGSAFGFTVQDQGTTPVGFAGSTTTLNFQGNGVFVTEAKDNIGVGGTIQVGVATVHIQKNQLDFEDANDFTRNTGITTIRVGMGLSFMAVPVGDNTSGIASIFSVADPNITFQDASGFERHNQINIIRIGAGLTISSPSVGIASITPNGHLEYLNVTGIASAPVFDGNLTGNVTGNVTGNITGDVTGDSSGTHTGAVTGNVTGNITGNVTGDLTGNSSGTHTGAVTGNVTGNVTGDLTGNSSGTHTGAVVGNVTGDLTGNVTSTGSNTLTTVSGTTATYTSFVGDLTGASSQITVAADTTDTTNSILFANTGTGDQAVKSNTALTFNAQTGALSATSFSGGISASDISGTLPALDGSNLTSVTTSTINITATDSTAADHFLTFVDTAGGSAETVRTDSGLIYNPGTNDLTIAGTLNAGTINAPATGLTGDPSISVTNVTIKGSTLPDVNGLRNLGSSTVAFNEIHGHNFYCADMHFSNVGRMVNDVDGTSGSWTLQEGDENIYMLNNITGKKYKISLTEV